MRRPFCYCAKYGRYLCGDVAGTWKGYGLSLGGLLGFGFYKSQAGYGFRILPSSYANVRKGG